MTETRPPLPPFTPETAIQKVQAAEDAWNSRDPDRVSLGYTVDSQWRNRGEHIVGRVAIVAFLTRKWQRELDYALRKGLWSFHDNRIAVRFQYECRDASGPVVAQLRQRIVGVRRGRPDGPTRGQHQRRRNQRVPAAILRPTGAGGARPGLSAVVTSTSGDDARLGEARGEPGHQVRVLPIYRGREYRK